MFKDITKFNNIEDYLPILTAIFIVELIGIILSYFNIIKSKFLKLWYQKFNLSAVLADVLVIFIGIIFVRAIYNYIFKTFSIIKKFNSAISTSERIFYSKSNWLVLASIFKI